MNNKPYLYLYYISRIYLTQALNTINVDFDILMYVMGNIKANTWLGLKILVKGCVIYSCQILIAQCMNLRNKYLLVSGCIQVNTTRASLIISTKYLCYLWWT